MAGLPFGKEKRKKKERRDRRKALRQAENAVDNVEDRIKEMKRDSDKQWEEARTALKSGQKAAAQRFITSYRAAQVLMTKMDQKRWVFKQYLTKMEMAQSDSEFAEAMAGLNKVTSIDPEKVADVFEESQDILGEQIDVERLWSKMYEKEMDGAVGSLEDRIPSMEEMTSQLEQEAAIEVGGGSAERVNSELDDQIGAGQERVKNLLDDK